ncbi:hypothetical protein Cgig2_017665 [Carnegiea gigantea]|uniref:Uncharacterized protein n=1 Tax=Carnegiea gigantea TaxID=171969 RepID=A0A9Q1QAT2_9CARY|nr:hypothetical protein Cgig2_017665 [Carnegiea gigantea]
MWASLTSTSQTTSSSDDAVRNVLEKVEACSTRLSKWNCETFGNVGKEINKLELQLKHERDAMTSPKTSFTWRSIFGDKNLIVCGSRWIVGNGTSLDVWESHYMPCPISFRVITPKFTTRPHLQVAEVIDGANVSWHDDLIRELFLPIGVDIILNIPLCPAWPYDRLIWDYSNDGSFTIRSVDHLLIRETIRSSSQSSSTLSNDMRKSI